jgi:hypothetical protein
MPALSQELKGSPPSKDTTGSSGITKPKSKSKAKRVTYSDAEVDAIKHALQELQPEKITINTAREIMEKTQLYLIHHAPQRP